jgi:hypothetical protein
VDQPGQPRDGLSALRADAAQRARPALAAARPTHGRAACEQPQGLAYHPGLISASEETELPNELLSLRWDPVVLYGRTARRSGRHFGLDYDRQARGPKLVATTHRRSQQDVDTREVEQAIRSRTGCSPQENGPRKRRGTSPDELPENPDPAISARVSDRMAPGRLRIRNGRRHLAPRVGADAVSARKR